MAHVALKQLVKVYNRQVVVRGIDLQIEQGSLVVLVGPSGCGKSTILRMIAGLETISHGELMIDGRLANDLPARDRGVAMVFQSYALYPHKTVEQNLAFSLKLVRLSKAEIERRIASAAGMLGLEPYLARKPAELSGGQRQRVAMGRALVREPKIFLFDEPLSNLDAGLRNQMRVEIRRLQRQLGITSIYVTHDQVEAMTLADVIVVLRDGELVQSGTPLGLFERPRDRFVAGFIGSPQMNFFQGRLAATPGGLEFRNDSLAIRVPADRHGGRGGDGQHVWAGLRAEDIVPAGHGLPPSNPMAARGRVRFAEMLGNETLLYGQVGAESFVSRMQQPREIRQHEAMEFHFNADRLHLFDRDTERHLAGW